MNWNSLPQNVNSAHSRDPTDSEGSIKDSGLSKPGLGTHNSPVFYSATWPGRGPYLEEKVCQGMGKEEQGVGPIGQGQSWDQEPE